MASSSCPSNEEAVPSGEENQFQSSPEYETVSNVVLDFDKVDTDGNPLTYEGRIKRHVLHGIDESPDVIAICGPGGVGKSTIVRGLMNDNDVRTKFPDGVHLISLGMDATPATVLREVCEVMRNAGAASTVEKLQAQSDVENAIREAISWFSEKRCAFFIDDVWTSEIGTGLISRLCRLGIEEKQSVVVLTTREANVASLAHRSERIRVDPREPQGRESQQILFCHAGIPQNELSDSAADGPTKEVLKICGGLPVCLAVAGRGVKMLMCNAQEQTKDPWSEYLVNLPNHREHLLTEHLTDYGNLYATFAASLALLDKQQEQKLIFETPFKYPVMYRRLCVLLKQTKVPARFLRHLWKLKNDTQARAVASRLSQVGLAEVGYGRDGSSNVWHLTLHDSLHDFAVSEARRHGDAVHAHQVLLNGYRTSGSGLSKTAEGRTQWWSKELRGDGYIHRNLCRHLKDSGEVSELVNLLETPCWIGRQLCMNDIWALHDDFTTGINAVVNANDEGDPQDETLLRLIREALVLSFGFIARNSDELWFQLYGRLLGHKERCTRVEKFLLEIRDKVKSRWLRSINPFLESPGSSTIRMIDTGANVTCMAVLEGTDCVACGYNTGVVTVVNVIRGVIENSWMAHEGRVCTIACGKRGTRIITGGMDNSAAVWEGKTGHCIFTYRGHSSRVNSVVVMADGQWAASASEDGTVQVWHMETGETRAAFMGYGPVRRIAVFPDAQHLVAGGADDTLRVWHIDSGLQIGEPLLGYNKLVNYVALTDDGKRIVSGSWDKVLRIQSAKPLERIGSVSEDDVLIELDPGVECISLSNDGKYIVSGHANGKIRLWDAISGAPIGSTLEGHSYRIRDISFLESSDVVVSTSSDGQIRVWDVFRMVQVTQPAQEAKITKVVFGPFGEQVVTGSMDGALRIWKTSSGSQVGETLTGHAGSISDLALTPNGRHMVSVSNEKDRTVRVWDLQSQKQLAELGWHTGWVSNVAIAPKGDYAVAGSLDKNVYLWNLNAVDQASFFSVLKGHTEWVLQVYVSIDGNRIISVGDSSEIFVWDILSRRCLKKSTCTDPSGENQKGIMSLVGEPCDNLVDCSRYNPQNITIAYREVLYNPTLQCLGTMECDIKGEAFYPHKNTFCVGLRDGRIALMKLENRFETGEGTAEKKSSDPEL